MIAKERLRKFTDAASVYPPPAHPHHMTPETCSENRFVNIEPIEKAAISPEGSDKKQLAIEEPLEEDIESKSRHSKWETRPVYLLAVKSLAIVKEKVLNCYCCCKDSRPPLVD